QRLKEAAEKAKCELSRTDSAEINLPFISADDAGARHLHTVLSRAQFEELVDDLIEKTRGPCEEALKMAGLRPEDVDEVLLVGGQTRTPKVVRRVAGAAGGGGRSRPPRGWGPGGRTSSAGSPTSPSTPTRWWGSAPPCRRGS